MSDEPDWKLELIDGLMGGCGNDAADQVMEKAAAELTAAWSDIDRLTASLSAEVTESERLRALAKTLSDSLGEEFEILESPFKERASNAEAALADERAHADALAEALTASTDELMSYAHSEYDGVWSDEDFDMIEAPYQAKLFQHRARRQG